MPQQPAKNSNSQANGCSNCITNVKADGNANCSANKTTDSNSNSQADGCPDCNSNFKADYSTNDKSNYSTKKQLTVMPSITSGNKSVTAKVSNKKTLPKVNLRVSKHKKAENLLLAGMRLKMSKATTSVCPKPKVQKEKERTDKENQVHH